MRLFDLIKESLHLYFNIKNSQDIYDLLTQVERHNKDSLFIEWFLNKGIPKLKSIDLNNLPKDDRFLAMLELDEYILKSEMDFADPEEIRSCIISFVSSLQQYIDLCREELNEEYRV
ncbi:SPBc2 prophage-derived protein [Bacillus subtilis]|nr:SPBc2 prophage-derived protein [Bacillus subtilis]